jgi:hypothetical protein
MHDSYAAVIPLVPLPTLSAIIAQVEKPTILPYCLARFSQSIRGPLLSLDFISTPEFGSHQRSSFRVSCQCKKQFELDS